MQFGFRFMFKCFGTTLTHHKILTDATLDKQIFFDSAMAKLSIDCCVIVLCTAPTQLLGGEHMNSGELIVEFDCFFSQQPIMVGSAVQ